MCLSTYFVFKNVSLEIQQEIMDKIASNTSKLQLLEKTHEIEEKEMETHKKNVAARNSIFDSMKNKNDHQSLLAETEIMFRNEESTRRDLVAAMKGGNKDSDTSLAPVVKVLGNFEGTLLLLLLYLLSFLYLSLFNKQAIPKSNWQNILSITIT